MKLELKLLLAGAVGMAISVCSLIYFGTKSDSYRAKGAVISSRYPEISRIIELKNRKKALEKSKKEFGFLERFEGDYRKCDEEYRKILTNNDIASAYNKFNELEKKSEMPLGGWLSIGGLAGSLILVAGSAPHKKNKDKQKS